MEPHLGEEPIDEMAHADGTSLPAVFGDTARTRLIAALCSEHGRDLNVSDMQDRWRRANHRV